MAGTQRKAAPGDAGTIGAAASGSSHVTATTSTSLSPRNSRSSVARSTRSATPTAVPLFPNDSSEPYVDLCASKQVSRVQETPRRWRGGRRREILICAPASTPPTRAPRAPRASRRTRGPASWSGSRASPSRPPRAPRAREPGEIRPAGSRPVRKSTGGSSSSAAKFDSRTGQHEIAAEAVPVQDQS